MSKRVLIICKDYPPLNSIGAQRPKAWFKYLPRYGYEVEVVTTVLGPSGEPNVHRVPIRSLDESQKPIRIFFRKTRSFFETWLAYLIPQTSRLWALYKKADTLLSIKDYDFIITTGEPFILFKFTELLSKKHKTKWIADYRDPWTSQPEGVKTSFYYSLLTKTLYRRIERKCIDSASMITTPARTYLEKIKKTTKHKHIELILNGHDIDFKVQQNNPSKTFKIGYSGRLYSHQPIEEFLDSFGEFLTRNNMPDNVKLVFYGLNDWKDQKKKVKLLAKNWLSFIEFRNKTDYQSYINQLASCHIYLLITKKDVHWLNAKVFDYLALPGTTMLFPNNDGELDLILKNTLSGVIVDSPKEITEFLQKSYDDFIHNKFKWQNTSIDRFSRLESTRKLASLLNEINKCVE